MGALRKVWGVFPTPHTFRERFGSRFAVLV